jgi:predicted dithiol-disulfide oxidoreductase (DUF899 family)
MNSSVTNSVANTATNVDAEIQKLEKLIVESRKQLNELRKQRSGDEVKDYQLSRKDGSTVSLSELFGDKSDLIIVHNMGQNCAYCTLWADGFNGEWRHFENRAGFALVSADKPTTMKEFTEGRNWGFTCLSGADSDFTKAMGYLDEKGGPLPGISTFKKGPDGKITRVAHSWFGPGDDFCGVWHIFTMLENGAGNWAPKLEY